MYPGEGTFVLIRPAQTFYERIKYEWQLAEEGRGKTYRAVTTTERWIPILFGVLHVVLAIIITLAIVGVLDCVK